MRELGPPPPGYGRYADFDRGNGGGFPGPHPPGMGGSGGPPGPRRNLEDVVCYKVRPLALIAVCLRAVSHTFLLPVWREGSLCEPLSPSRPQAVQAAVIGVRKKRSDGLVVGLALLYRCRFACTVPVPLC